MFIDDCYFHVLPQRTQREPRERYKQYYRDLHARHQITLDENTLLTGSQYSFSELANIIFDDLIEKQLLHQLDLIVLSYWANEFDPDYVSTTAYLVDHYQLNCKIFDVTGNGSVSASTALQIIKQYQSNLTSQKALCFSLQQTTVPRAQLNQDIIPTQTVASAIILSHQKNQNHFLKIIDIQSWSEINISQHIHDLLYLYQIHLYDCVIVCKQNSIFYRSNISQDASFHFLPPHYGCTDFFYLIHQLHHTSFYPSKSFVLFFDEDVESLSTVLIILKKEKYAHQ